MRSPGCSVVLFALLVAGPHVALSQPEQPKPTPEEAHSAPTAEEVAAAREHYSKGKHAQDAGDYDTAANEYLSAYAAVPQPLLLYNVAQAKRLSGDVDAAIDYYQQYLDLDPEGPGAENSRDILVELREARKQDKPPAPPVESEEERARSQPIEPDAPRELLPPPSRAKDRTESGRTLKIVGLTSAGIGLIAIGAGVFFGLDAQSKSDQISDFEGTWDSDSNKLFDDGESAERRMLLSTSLGAAACVTGGVLYYLGRRKDLRTEQLQVSVSEHAASASLTGHF